MHTSRAILAALLLTLGFLGVPGPAGAQLPGIAYPPLSEASDQKAGSVLIYNLYTSSAANALNHNTRITLTNSSNTSAAFNRLFFVDGATGSVASSFLCLTSNQTASFDVSTIRPDVTGYLVVITVDGVLGCPLSFNNLTGQAHVKFPGSHRGTLEAVALAALYLGSLPGCDANSVTATVQFDNVTYNRLPRVLQLPDVPSRLDGNATLLAVNRIAGNFATGAGVLGPITGNLYDDTQNVFTFGFTATSPQFRATLTNSFPVTAPPFDTVIPSGRTGWLRLNSTSDIGILGAAFYLNAGQAPPPVGFPFPSKSASQPTPPSTFAGAVNLRALTLSGLSTLIVPVTPPTCS